MRILITNDDGIFAPGIAALARGIRATFADRHELMVVAPLTDHSGAGAAVGAVYERESIPYESVEIPGLGDVPTYGIDGSPALGVILACIEGFGPRPELVVSGINHGINAGRSALHSGTVGAALTGAQFGVRGLAVSIAWSSDPVPWETAVGLATGIVPGLAETEPGTVLNLNVPAVTPDKLRGLRHGTLGTIGLIRSVRPEQRRVAGRRRCSRPDGRSGHPHPARERCLDRAPQGAGGARTGLRRSPRGRRLGICHPRGRRPRGRDRAGRPRAALRIGLPRSGVVGSGPPARPSLARSASSAHRGAC